MKGWDGGWVITRVACLRMCERTHARKKILSKVGGHPSAGADAVTGWCEKGASPLFSFMLSSDKRRGKSLKGVNLCKINVFLLKHKILLEKIMRVRGYRGSGDMSTF